MQESLDRIIREEEAGRSVGFVLRRLLGLSERRIRSLKFTDNGVLLDGRPARTSDPVQAGQTLSVRLPDKAKDVLLPSSFPLDILYEDSVLVAVNKPAELAVHPAGGHAADTLANALRAHFDASDPAARVHLCGRLDKDTSGIVLCVKNAAAADRLRRDLAEEGFGKAYLAFAVENFSENEKEGVIRLPLSAAEPDGKRLIRMQADRSDGKAAVTSYHVEQQFPGYALLSVRLGSGRTHQIRAHLAAVGHPLLGDPLYGDAALTTELPPLLKRTALHAASVRFPHPFTRELIELSAPLPEDLAALLR